jgi:hypothetical protein
MGNLEEQKNKLMTTESFRKHDDSVIALAILSLIYLWLPSNALPHWQTSSARYEGSG